MEININLVLADGDDGCLEIPDDADAQAFLLTPRELGDAISAFFKALNAKGQLMDPVLQLPYYNDDSEDVFAVIKEGTKDERYIPYVTYMHGCRIVTGTN